MARSIVVEIKFEGQITMFVDGDRYVRSNEYLLVKDSEGDYYIKIDDGVQTVHIGLTKQAAKKIVRDNASGRHRKA